MATKEYDKDRNLTICRITSYNVCYTKLLRVFNPIENKPVVVDNEEFISKCVITSYSIHYTKLYEYSVFVDNEIDKEEEAKKAYKIFEEWIINKSIKTYMFGIYFIEDSHKTEYFNNFFGEKKGTVKFDIDKMYSNGQLINFTKAMGITRDGITDYKSLEEIINKYKY